MKLTEVEIVKYKSIEKSQTFNIDNGITILVGMNESGKSAVLEALAKSNYLDDDPEFKFNPTFDYPRRQKKLIDKSGGDPVATNLKYEVDDKVLGEIASDVGEGVFTEKTVSRSTSYANRHIWDGVRADMQAFRVCLKQKLPKASDSLLDKIVSVSDLSEFSAIVNSYKQDDLIAQLNEVAKYFHNEWSWTNPINEYIARTHLTPALPRFIYYSEYYALPARISLEQLQNENLSAADAKTALALIELAEIDLDEILSSEEFESFKAELEATQAIISDELFKYWKTNTNLSIDFDVDKVERRDPGNHRVVDHVLDIRVRNSRAGITLPLKNRSKGFNWFFSFLVWFKRIQEDKSSPVVLLLDEPGLNLHASAQADLLEFINDLSSDYQIIYSTHSPFMVETSKLGRVRTVVETKEGTRISDSVQEKDPDTLFPLQAALGYDLAQNLFVSNKNLLVEGVSDLMILETVSQFLLGLGRVGLDPELTIVPAGGLDKVASFISLLRGNKLGIICALDTISDHRSRQRLQDLERGKLVNPKNILFFDSFVDGAKEADVEDLFDPDDYLRYFNMWWDDGQINVADLDPNLPRITRKIAKHLGTERYNHYGPAHCFLTSVGGDHSLSDATLHRFEALFTEINNRV